MHRAHATDATPPDVMDGTSPRPPILPGERATKVKMGELHVRLTGNDHVTADQISGAVQEAGIVGHFTKMGGSGKKS